MSTMQEKLRSSSDHDRRYEFTKPRTRDTAMMKDRSRKRGWGHTVCMKFRHERGKSGSTLWT